MVLVADFDGRDKSYGVTETIISHLREETKSFDEAKIAALNETVTEQEGSFVRERQGKNLVRRVLWCGDGTGCRKTLLP